MERANKKAKKSNNVDNEVDNKVVHTSARGNRFYYANNDERTQHIYCCTGKDDTCTNQVVKGGLCVACGATFPRCKGFIEGGNPCPNQARRGGLCRTHDENPPVCTGVNDDDSPCTNRATTRGLCERHGRRGGKCPCGRVRKICRKCKPLGNLVGRIRAALRRTTYRYIRNKPSVAHLINPWVTPLTGCGAPGNIFLYGSKTSSLRA